MIPAHFLDIHQSPAQGATLTKTRRPLRDDVYRDLSERITRGELPPGARVRDGAMALELGVSRTPVREALLRLAREGLLDSDLGRGFTVRPLSREELLDLTSIIATLECLALRSSDIFPDARLRELDELNGALVSCEDAERAIALHEEWHRMLVDGSRNQHLRPLLTSLNDARRRYLYTALRYGGLPEYWTEEHAAIVESLRLGDRAAAETLLAVHWHRSLDAQIAWLDGHSKEETNEN